MVEKGVKSSLKSQSNHKRQNTRFWCKNSPVCVKTWHSPQIRKRFFAVRCNIVTKKLKKVCWFVWYLVTWNLMKITEGKTTTIISTGKIEQIGSWLATGKHNYVLQAAGEWNKNWLSPKIATNKVSGFLMAYHSIIDSTGSLHPLSAAPACTRCNSKIIATYKE